MCINVLKHLDTEPLNPIPSSLSAIYLILLNIWYFYKKKLLNYNEKLLRLEKGRVFL